MSQAGFDVADRAGALSLVDARLAAARTGTAPDGTPRYDESLLQATQRWERSLAAADVRCTAPLRAGYQRVRADLSAEVRRRHPDEIARVVKALGQG